MFLNYNKLINMMKNLEGQDCINYYRVSTKKQGNGTSLADQKELCMNRCKEMKLNIVEEFEEMASAMKGGKRPKFNAMVQMFKEGKAKVLVAAFPDRITRNGTDGDTIKALVEDYGVTAMIVMIAFALLCKTEPSSSKKPLNFMLQVFTLHLNCPKHYLKKAISMNYSLTK